MFGLGAWWKREIGFRAQTAVSQKILLSSATAERDCLRFYPSTRGRTHVARFAVPLDDWPDAPTALKALHDAGIHRDFVFLPNQLWHHKNHLVAIEAAGILAKRGSKRQIIATGRGGDPRRPGYRQELISRIEQSGAKGHFLLLEGVDHEQVKAMMIGANALLNPSRFEGWSTTVEEAKAIGTPLLLSDLDVHREQASAALFFEPDDALSLADAIETLPIRTPEVIASSIAAAREQNRLREIEFAQSISKLVKQVAENDRGHRAR
jgi:glycosyltransferase involved in cell wall biosynthesis